MACEYCEQNSSKYSALVPNLDVYGKTIDIYVLKDTLYFRGVVNGYRDTIHIKFCPMCGRKLSE